MGIRDQLAAHDARFIAFDVLLTAVAEAEGVSVEEAARHMSIHNVLSGAIHRLRNYLDGSFSEGCGDAAFHCLESAIHQDKNIWISDSAQNEINAGEPGFFRDEIAITLAACGIAVPACLKSTEPQAKPAEAAKAVPAPPTLNLANLLPFVPRVNITLGEAADLLAEANGGKWYATLEDAVDSGPIQGGSWSMDRDEQPLSHDDIRAWCEAGGIVWPVPLPLRVAPATDAGLRAELEAVTRERDELRVASESAKERAPALAANLKARWLAEKDAELVEERRRSTELAAEVARLRAEIEARPAHVGIDWANHDTKLFKLLPKVIRTARDERAWPKQATFVADLRAAHALSEAEAKALDMVTRPDSLRGR